MPFMKKNEDMSEEIPVTEEETAETAAEEQAAEEQPQEAEAQPEVNPLEEQLQAAQAQAEEYLNLAQHVQADFDNYRRRTKATRAEAYAEGAQDFIKTLLPVVDNLERAMAQESADEAMKKGVELVYKQLMDVLAKKDVKEINRLGEKFDPNLENAVLQGDASEGEPGTVCAVLQKGYQMGDFVLRHAMVKVVAE